MYSNAQLAKIVIDAIPGLEARYTSLLGLWPSSEVRGIQDRVLDVLSRAKDVEAERATLLCPKELARAAGLEELEVVMIRLNAMVALAEQIVLREFGQDWRLTRKHPMAGPFKVVALDKVKKGEEVPPPIIKIEGGENMVEELDKMFEDILQSALPDFIPPKS